MTEPAAGNGKAWGAPLLALDGIWTAIEQRLAVWVIIAEIATLVVWVSLKGLASLYQPDVNAIGLIYRSLFTAVALGFVTHLVMKPKKGAAPKKAYPIAVTSAVFVGLFLGRAWVALGVDWNSNVIGWLQNASVLMLIGGPRGLVTRLTLWLALLGASLAASKGKHINIDIATRYFPPRLALPAALASLTAASAVCLAASFGFVDSIAVTKFRAEAFHACTGAEGGEGKVCDTSAVDRFGVALSGMSTDLFLFTRQLTLDLRTLPRVLTGKEYDRYLTGADWNEWVKGSRSSWESHFPKESVASMIGPEGDTGFKMPAVVAPDTGENRDLLIRDLNFVLPFGLLIIGIKFLLRILLILSGHVTIDPEAAHAEAELVHTHQLEEEPSAKGTR